MITLVAGPRVGKSTAYVIPAIADAPGRCSPRRTSAMCSTRRGSAREQGPRVGVRSAEHRPGAADLVVEPALVRHRRCEGREAGRALRVRFPRRRQPRDAYFDNAGQDLLAGFLLAAALEHLPITTAFTWTTVPGDDEPVRILRRHGYDQMADSVSGQVNGESRRRDSVYGTAAQMASCLKVRAIAQWVTRKAARTRGRSSTRTVSCAAPTRSTASKEGRGTAGPLVTALTAATVEAAEEYATTQPGGRLQTPMLGVLDEAANVCRWHDLPDLYSHYGSRGIVLMTILQSWSQGVQVWGRDGMRKLWSASNVAVYGGGVKEPEFLNELSQMIGDYDRRTTSTSVGRGSRSTSHGIQRERTLDIADLGALPRGRAVVFASGALSDAGRDGAVDERPARGRAARVDRRA